MIIPDFWDEHKEKRKISTRRQATITRFGWSDISKADAKRHAKQRVDEAFKKLADGHEVERRELRVSYNGSEGVPIREEIVQFHGDAIVTRNLYGSLCLNTPNVLFADIDFDLIREANYKTFWAWLLIILGYLQFAYAPNLIYNFSWNTFGFELQYYTAKYLYEINPGILLSGIGIALWVLMKILNGRPYGTIEQREEKLIDKALIPVKEFSENHPDWRMRIYQTPAGLRVLVMHDIFNPIDPIVENFFATVGTDPVFVFMCKMQECFRARVSPKPWRISEPKLDQGVWPVDRTLIKERKDWVSSYEMASQGYASCRYLKTIGSELLNEKCEKLRVVHDDYCRAHEEKLKLA